MTVACLQIVGEALPNWVTTNRATAPVNMHHWAIAMRLSPSLGMLTVNLFDYKIPICFKKIQNIQFSFLDASQFGNADGFDNVDDFGNANCFANANANGKIIRLLNTLFL